MREDKKRHGGQSRIPEIRTIGGSKGGKQMEEWQRFVGIQMSRPVENFYESSFDPNSQHVPGCKISCAP